MMWTRRELKERAKEALRRNYWKIVLVSSLLLLLGGGVGSVGIGKGNGRAVSQEAENVGEAEFDEWDWEEDDGDADNNHHMTVHERMQGEKAAGQKMPEIPSAFMTVAFLISLAVFLAIAVLIFLLVVAVDVFLYNPFSVGVGRFMLKSVDDRAEVKEVVYGFDHSYKNIVRTLFHRDLQILLWALLFIIPGIYKKYEYRLVSYIMAEHPDMDYRSALQMSKEMMNGHKWKAFVLDISFILWHFLGTITCGIVEFLYVQPYHQLTYAALYRRLEGTDGGVR